jgi:Xaa-Pro aminopeptidase
VVVNHNTPRFVGGFYHNTTETLFPRGENKSKLFHWLGINLMESQKTASVELIKAVIAQREIKSEEEILEIEKEVNTTVDMHVAAIKMARPGTMESDIAAKVQEIAMNAGGNISFPIIATIHGENLHYHFHGHLPCS